MVKPDKTSKKRTSCTTVNKDEAMELTSVSKRTFIEHRL